MIKINEPKWGDKRLRLSPFMKAGGGVILRAQKEHKVPLLPASWITVYKLYEVTENEIPNIYRPNKEETIFLGRWHGKPQLIGVGDVQPITYKEFSEFLGREVSLGKEFGGKVKYKEVRRIGYFDEINWITDNKYMEGAMPDLQVVDKIVPDWDSFLYRETKKGPWLTEEGGYAISLPTKSMANYQFKKLKEILNLTGVRPAKGKWSKRHRIY